MPATFSHFEPRRSGDGPRPSGDDFSSRKLFPFGSDARDYQKYEDFPSPTAQVDPPPRKRAQQSTSHVRSISKRRTTVKKSRKPTTSLWCTLRWNLVKLLLLLKLLLVFWQCLTRITPMERRVSFRLVEEFKHQLCQIPGTSMVLLNCNLHNSDDALGPARKSNIDYLIPGAVHTISRDMNTIPDALDAIISFQGDAVEFYNRPRKPRTTVLNLTSEIRIDLLRLMDDRDGFLKQINSDATKVVQSYDPPDSSTAPWTDNQYAITNTIKSWFEPLEQMSYRIDRLGTSCDTLYKHTQRLIYTADTPTDGKSSWLIISKPKPKSTLPRLHQDHKALLKLQTSSALKNAQASIRRAYTFFKAAEKEMKAQRSSLRKTANTHDISSFDGKVVDAFEEARILAGTPRGEKSLFTGAKVKVLTYVEWLLEEIGKE
jgi:hypothetical protein